MAFYSHFKKKSPLSRTFTFSSPHSHSIAKITLLVNMTNLSFRGLLLFTTSTLPTNVVQVASVLGEVAHYQSLCSIFF